MPQRKKRSLDKEKQKKDIEKVAIEGAATETVQRYGSAAKEHLTAYSGVDNEKGKKLSRGLKKIAKYKVNPGYKESNLEQQAGFAAEEKYRARQNAEKIIKGDKTRIERTDDIGRVNDPLYDHVQLDSEGMVIPGTGEQMKFVGSSPKACWGMLKSRRFQKYLDADAKITVPSDYYDGILEEADKEIAKLERQLERAKESGNTERVSEMQAKIERLKKIKSNLRNSGISNKEAMFARTHPRLSTAIDMGKIAHRAGMDQAKYGATIAGSISLVNNTVAVIKGEKRIKDAARDVALSTGQGAVQSYATAFSGSIIKSAMQNSRSQAIRTLSKTNIASTMVTTALETGKTFRKYIKGDITGVECLEELGQNGVNQISVAMFATVGQTLIPIPVVGGMVGSLVGYAWSSSCYKELVNAIHEEKLAKEERIRIESECAEAIGMIRQFRMEMNAYVDRYLSIHSQVFESAFLQMNNAIGKDYIIEDINAFIVANNNIRIFLGHPPVITSIDELEDKTRVFKL